jgi:hypothetical protein
MIFMDGLLQTGFLLVTAGRQAVRGLMADPSPRVPIIPNECVYLLFPHNNLIGRKNAIRPYFPLVIHPAVAGWRWRAGGGG